MTPIKQIPTNLILLSAVLTLSLFLASCGGGGDGDEPGPGPNGNSLEVVGFSPDSAYEGEEVQVQGLGFSPEQSENQLFFGGDAEATTDSVTLTEGSDSGTLFTTVPEGATDGPIAVEVDGNRAETGAYFNVIEAESTTGDDKLATLYWAGYSDLSTADYVVVGQSYVNEQGRKFSELLYDLYDIYGADIDPSSPRFYGLALDLNADLMYWADWGLSGSDPVIMRAALDGSASTVDTLYTQSDGIGNPIFMVLDLEKSDLYWGDLSQGIQKGSLDGTESVETVYSASSAGIEGAVGIDMRLDSQSDMLYWTELQAGEIARAPKDGSGPVEVLFEANDATPSLGEVFDIAVNTEDNYLLVSDAPSSSNQSGRILKGSLDGGGTLETIYDDRPEIYQSAIAYDEQRDYVYWKAESSAQENGISKAIMRGKADGSSEVEVAYDLREFGVDPGVSHLYGTQIFGIAVAPDESSAKAKSKGNSQIPPVYLEF